MTRHIGGAWNWVWTDMMPGDRTHFMRYGKGPRGLIGITVKPNAMKTWALSLHICCSIQKDIREMTLVPTRDDGEKPSQRGNVQMAVENS